MKTDLRSFSIAKNINLIKSNKFLFQAYKKKFDLIKNRIKNNKSLEIGSGSGIASYFLKNIITSESKKTSNTNLAFNVYRNKLKKKVGIILMVDVFHHLHRPCVAIKNLKKSLKKNGKIVMLEPYVSPISFIFYFIIGFTGPKEKLGFFKTIDLSLKKSGIKEEFAFVMQPQKFIKSNLNKKKIRVDYISEYYFFLTGGLSFYKIQKWIPNFVYNLSSKFDEFINKSQSIFLKKIFATKILVELKY